MYQRELKDLGKLNKEQKEQTWKTTISGSQAWMLINEPYNLIRDKLDIERIHKSKYDFFNSNKFKKIGENAMACGTMYEKVVMEEVKQHYPNAIYEDHTYQLTLKTGELIIVDKITSTPDFYLKDGDTFTLIGDIKCSKSASDEEAMTERYYYQALHNCYVSNCKNFILTAKNEITGPLNMYQFTFTNEDFEDYENKLVNFFFNLNSRNFQAYDSLYEQNQTKKVEGKVIEIKELVQYEAQQEEASLLEKLAALKLQEKAIKDEISTIEDTYKQKYDNLLVSFNNKVFEIKATERRGTIDYTKAIKEISEKYNFPKTEFDSYRKEPTLVKTITIKEN